MSEAQSRAAKRRHQRDSGAICPTCDGSGRVLTLSARAIAKKGGNASYRKSLDSGQLSMSDRGKLGGAPRLLTVADLEAGRRKEYAAPAGTRNQATQPPRSGTKA